MKATLLICVLSLFAHSVKAEWLTDLPAALRQAKAEDKAVLINFTGSDWCGWCIRLKKEVFDQPQFRSFAAENLVLVDIDFPRGKQQPKALQDANRRLQAQYEIRGYPTIFILDKNGKTVSKTGYQEGGPKNYIAYLTRIKGVKWRTVEVEAPADPVLATPPEATPPQQVVPPAFYRPPQPPPVPPEDLTLKGVMGSKKNRLALINDKTFSEGETGLVKLKDKEVTIQCKAIHADFVVIQVSGEDQPRELKFSK